MRTNSSELLEYKLSENFFITIIDRKLYLWDYVNHKQFELDKNDILTIVKLLYNCQIDQSEKKILNLLYNESIVSTQNDSEAPCCYKTWPFDLLSYIYHRGIYDTSEEDVNNLSTDEFVKDYLNHSSEIIDNFNFRPLFESEPIQLADLDPKIFKINYFDVLKSRRTSRSFIPFEFSFSEFSSLLKLVYGDFHTSDSELEEKGVVQYSKRKTSPSGGNIHPEEAFVYVYNVESLEEGLYYFNNQSETLHSCSEARLSYSDLRCMLNGQFFADNSSFVLFHTCRLEKISWKYKHSKSYRLSFVEAGAFTQTFQLSATALGRKFWQTGMFKDKMIDEFLGLSSNEICQFVMAVGEGDGSAIPKEFNKMLIHNNNPK